jgi:hypothetical protein
MTVILRRGAAVLLSAAVMTTLFGGLRLTAQEAGKAQADTTAKKTTKRAFDPTRRVPDYFGQLGLSAAQKESIYKIRAKHQPKIDALEHQLEELRSEMVKDCESVLTDAQKKMLTERRANAAEARAKRSAASDATPKPQG